jgi:hypothetical protein
MGAIRNRRCERYAQLRAGGMSRLDAMKEAGYVPAEANSRRLDNRADVKARIAELYRLHADFVSADIARVLIEQTRIAYSNIKNLVERAEDGSVQVKDLTTLAPELTACIQQLKVDKDGKVFIKLYDKTSALQALQRYLDPDPLPPDDRRGIPAKPEQPVYLADDDWSELAKPEPPRLQ